MNTKHNNIYTFIDPLNSKICFFKLISNKFFDSKNEVHFGCAKKYEEDAQAKKTQQADKYEGAVAILKKGNALIEKFKMTYKDIVLLEDGDYCILKRESSLYLPMYCFYCADSSDSHKIEVKKEGKKCIIKYYLNPNSEIFNDFNEGNKCLLLYIFNPTFFKYKMIEKLKLKNKNGRLIDYDIEYYSLDSNGEWVCPNYKNLDKSISKIELAYKRRCFSYQKERRFIYFDEDVQKDNFEWVSISMDELTEEGYATVTSDLLFVIEQPIYINNDKDYIILEKDIQNYNKGRINE